MNNNWSHFDVNTEQFLLQFVSRLQLPKLLASLLLRSSPDRMVWMVHPLTYLRQTRLNEVHALSYLWEHFPRAIRVATLANHEFNLCIVHKLDNPSFSFRVFTKPGFQVAGCPKTYVIHKDKKTTWVHCINLIFKGLKTICVMLQRLTRRHRDYRFISTRTAARTLRYWRKEKKGYIYNRIVLLTYASLHQIL